MKITFKTFFKPKVKGKKPLRKETDVKKNMTNISGIPHKVNDSESSVGKLKKPLDDSIDYVLKPLNGITESKIIESTMATSKMESILAPTNDLEDCEFLSCASNEEDLR